VKVSNAQPIGGLANILYVDLYNVNESEAKKRLLKAVVTGKKGLSSKPLFPETKDNEKVFMMESKFPGTKPISNSKFNNEKLIIDGNEKVQAIRQAFEKNNTVSSTLALLGLGGIGKTVMAQKYVYQYGYLYDLIWWVSANNKESIIYAYKDFIIRNNLVSNTSYKQCSDIAIESTRPPKKLCKKE